MLQVVVDKTIVNKNLGIVIGTLMMDGTVMGNPLPKKIRFSSVFVNESGVWKLQSRTLTPIRGR